LEIFTERKISTEAVADIKLTEEEIQAIRKRIQRRGARFFTLKLKRITDQWAFEEGVSYTNSFPLRDDSHKCHLVFTDQTTLL
jgi:transposase